MTQPAQIKPATLQDVGVILQFIKDLAIYEKLLHEVEATEEKLMATLFGERPFAECVIAYLDDAPVGFALFFHNYSTFLAKSGLHLEDLYVSPDMRGKGIGKQLILHLAKIAHERGCGRFEWSVLDWNEPAIQFYLSLGAEMMDGWTTCRVTGNTLTKLAQA